MTKYEFKLVQLNQSSPDCLKLDKFLNQYGKDGWQLADFQSMGAIKACILQRELRELPNEPNVIGMMDKVVND